MYTIYDNDDDGQYSGRRYAHFFFHKTKTILPHIGETSSNIRLFVYVYYVHNNAQLGTIPINRINQNTKHLKEIVSFSSAVFSSFSSVLKDTHIRTHTHCRYIFYV